MGRGRLSFQVNYNSQKTKSFLAFMPITTSIALILVIIMATIMKQQAVNLSGDQAIPH